MINYHVKNILLLTKGPIIFIVEMVTVLFQGLIFSSNHIFSLDYRLLIIYYILPILISLFVILIPWPFIRGFESLPISMWLTQISAILVINHNTLVPTISLILLVHLVIGFTVWISLPSICLRSKVNHKECNYKKDDRY